MADMTRTRHRTMRSDERGEMLIIGLVLFALVLLTVYIAFAHTWTTTPTLTDSTNDIEHAESTHDELAVQATTVITRENREMESGVTTDVTDSIQTINQHTQHANARRGVRTTLTVDSTTPGTRSEWQTPTRNFTDPDANTDWTLADNIDNTRRFRMTVTPSELAGLSNTSTATLDGNAFGVELETRTGTVTQHVYRNTSTGDITVTAVETGTVKQTCSISKTTDNEIKFTTTTLTGDTGDVQCSALWPDTAVKSIAFTNADAVAGRFAFITRGAGLTSHGDIDTAPAVYNVTMTYTYTSPDTVFNTTTTITPSEPITE